MSTKIDFAKSATSWIVGAGVGSIVQAIIRNNTALPETDDDSDPSFKENLTNRVAVPAAGIVVSMMAKDACSAYTDAQIDKAVEWWQKHISKTYVDPETDTEK